MHGDQSKPYIIKDVDVQVFSSLLLWGSYKLLSDLL
jgi:hypothetical protein